MLQFVVSCLNIPEATYTQIERSVNQKPFNTLLRCMIIWRNRLECEGKDAAKNLKLVQQMIEDKYSKPSQSRLPPSPVQPTDDSKCFN